MKDLVQGFTEQLVKAKEIANQFQPASSDLTFSDIVISGLGGSGIGGRIAVEVVSEEISIPAVCNHHYTIPNFVSASTLFIACSYSGNTEETVEALHSALEKGHLLFVLPVEESLTTLLKKINCLLFAFPAVNLHAVHWGILWCSCCGCWKCTD